MRTNPYLKVIVMVFWLSAGNLARSQEVPLRAGAWNADELGNHRAVIHVEAKAEAVRTRIPWRRRDQAPEKKAVIFTDSRSGRRVKNVVPIEINREFGDFVFEPAFGAGDYYAYYLPYKLAGSRNYPNAVYLAPERTADETWLSRIGMAVRQAERASQKESRIVYAAPPARQLKKFPEAAVLRLEAVDEFNGFSSMEMIATAEETQRLISRFPDASYLLFPEDREFSIRMADDLPLRWIEKGPQKELRSEAARGEFFAFQLGVWACRAQITDLAVVFGPLEGSGGAVIPASSFRCINTGGTGWDGLPLKKACPVGRGKVQALWCGVQVPPDCSGGTYEAEIRIQPRGLEESRIRLILSVTNKFLADAGDADPKRMSRLRWLDSTLAFDDDVVAPFTALKIEGDSVSCLGRTVELARSGFPKQIRSFFSAEVTRILDRGRDLLTAPFDLVIEDMAGRSLAWEDSGLQFVEKKPGAVAWEATRQADSLTAAVKGRMEMDGYLEFEVRLSALRHLEVKEIYLEVPFVADVARYMMGLGQKGGLRPAEFSWRWDQRKNQDALWIGDVNSGIQIGLRAENYVRPLNTNFYLSKPLLMPPSWFNEGKGSVSVKPEGGCVIFKASGGPRLIEPGSDLYFNFTLLLTPFKTLETKSQWATRFFHAFKPLDEVAAAGANTINVHHATDINPYINYPFLRPADMKAYIDEAHRRGFKVKIYNTIRELSNHAPELFALRSLGAEIFSPGPGGGYSWLQEHLGSDYIAAWFVPQLKDAAIINSGMSRWHNYYIEGLNWLAKNVGIDGLYLDDIAFDRTTMKRVRKVLDRDRPGALIDLHSANQYNPRDGFASSANLYLEHFPYVNRLWFGEYFDYNGSPPDYWLVEISGIPFGVMGEMLQDGGNPWRGMVYGMTNRLPWSGKNPAHIWKVWDEFGMGETRMIGYWSPACPVKTDHPEVLATAYVKKDGVLVALASWAKGPVLCRLKIDWHALGLDPKKAKLRAPEIPDVQFAAEFAPDDPIPFEPGKGWLLIIQ